MSEKDKKAIENLRNPAVTKLIYGENAFRAVGRLVTINRPGSNNIKVLEVHGNLVSPEAAPNKSETWEIMECEVIVIPRRKWEKLPESFKRCRAEQVYLSGILSDPDKFMEER